MFQLSNRLAGLNENFYEFFTVAKYPNMLRTLLFWVVTQRVVVTTYGRFGKNLLFPPSYVRNPKCFRFLNPEDGTNILSRNVGKKLSLLAA